MTSAYLALPLRDLFTVRTELRGQRIMLLDQRLAAETLRDCERSERLSVDIAKVNMKLQAIEDAIERRRG